MSDPRIDILVEKARAGEIDRRTFMRYAFALGMSATAVSSVLASAAHAQDGEFGSLTPENLGVPGVAHVTGTDKGTINIYSSWPMTAASEQLGGDMAAACQFAVDVWGGEAGGFAISYTALDDGIAANQGSWDPTVEANNATQAVNDPDCMVYIATYNTGAAEVSIPITNEGGLAMISPANTGVRLTKQSEFNPEGYPDVLYPTGTRNYMRVVAADDLQGATSANWAYNVRGLESAYIIHDNQAYGQGLASVFQAVYEELGGSVVGFEAFDAEAPEYQALATKIAATGAQIVYISAIVNLNASKLVQDLRDVMSVDDVVLLGPDGLFNQEFVDGAGDAAEGMFLTIAGLPANALEGIGAEWATILGERLGREPAAYAAYCFDSMVCALQAIDAVGEKDRAAILETMFATEGFRGLVGEWSFTETGDTTADTISLNIVTDSVITFQEVIGLPA